MTAPRREPPEDDDVLDVSDRRYDDADLHGLTGSWADDVLSPRFVLMDWEGTDHVL